MKNLFFLLLIPAFGFAQANSGTKTTGDKKNSLPTTAKQQGIKDAMAKANLFVVTGQVQGLADGEVKITTPQGDKTIATGTATNGQFVLKGTLEEPGLYWLTMGKEQPQYIFLENAAIKISGVQGDIKKLKIEGSQSHNDFLEFRRVFDPLFANINAIGMELQRSAEDKKPALMQQYSSAITALNNEAGNFISARKSSYVSLFLLSVTKQINEDINALEQRFNLLHAALKTSPGGKELESYISYAKVGQIGSNSLDFMQNDVNDKPVALSSFKGKYVLVDFWASWCKPCRLENPNVVNAYNKFKNKNFTVLGVSLDQQKEAWLKAIEKDKLAWTQVSDLMAWNNAAAQLYHVQSIPQNFLIDPAGKIIAKDLRGPELERRLCEILGCN